MNPFKDPKFDKEKSEKTNSPFCKQPTFDSKKRMYPAGEYYGTGMKAKIGKMRSDSVGMDPVPKNKMNIDPRSLG